MGGRQGAVPGGLVLAQLDRQPVGEDMHAPDVARAVDPLGPFGLEEPLGGLPRGRLRPGVDVVKVVFHGHSWYRPGSPETLIRHVVKTDCA